MNGLLTLDVCIEATAAARSIMRRYPAITDSQARAIVRVEVTHDGFHRIAAAAELSSEVFRDEPASPLRQVARVGFGCFEVMGFAYYLVPSLEDGAAWRVVNPLA